WPTRPCFVRSRRRQIIQRVERLPRGKRETRGTPQLPVSQPSGYPRALLHPHGRGEYLDPTVCSRRTQGVRENCLWTDRPRTSPLPRLRRRHAPSWLLRAWMDELHGKTTWLRVLRMRCSACGVTHAVVPWFLAPYQRMSTPCLEHIARRWASGRRGGACWKEPAAACAR